MSKVKCANPYCTGFTQTTNNFGLCFACGKQVQLLVWILPQILDIKEKTKLDEKVEEKQPEVIV